LLWAAGKLAGQQQQQQQKRQQQQHLKGAAAAKSRIGIDNSASSSSSSCCTSWLDPLLAAALPRLKQHSGHTLSNIIWSLAVLGHQPDRLFLEACFAELLAKASGLSAAAAAASLWGISKLGLLPAPQTMAPLLLQLQQVLPDSSQQQLVYIAAALAHFKRQQQDSAAAAVQQPLVASSSSSSSAKPPEEQGPAVLPDELLQQYMTTCGQQLFQFPPGQLCQLGRWLAVAGICPDQQWALSFLESAARQLHRLNPSHHLILLQTLGLWRVQPPHGWAAMFLAAVAGEQSVRGYSADHIGALLQGLAAARLQPQQQQLEILLARLLQGEAGLSAAAVASVLQGCGQLRFRPPEPWLQRFWAAAGSSSVLAGADAATLAAVAASLQLPQLQQLRMRPSKQWAATYHAAVAAALPKMLPQQAAAVLAGLAAVHRQPGGQQQQLLSDLMLAAGSGLQQLQLAEVVAAWWCLVEFGMLSAAAPLQLVADVEPPVAQMLGMSHQQQQQQQQHHWQLVWLQRLLFHPEVSVQLAALSRRSLLQLSDCLGRLQQQVPGSWAASYVTALTPHIPHLAPHELVSAMACLPCLGGAAAHPQLTSLLMTALQPQLPLLSPAQLSDVLVMAQSSGALPPEPWLTEFAEVAGRCLSAFRGRQLIKVMTSFARLRFLPCPDFLSAAAEAVVEKLGSGVPMVLLVDLLWALTALHVRPGAAWFAKFEARVLEKGLDRLDGQQLSRFGWCMAVLQRKPGQVVMAKFLVAAGGAMASMDARR
jgi:hypothetical protein